MTTTLVAVLLTTVVVTVLTVVTVVAYLRSPRVLELPLPGRRGTYVVPAGYDVDRLVYAVDLAEAHLSTVWPLDDVRRVLDGVCVIVMQYDNWLDAWGRTVAGSQTGAVLRVDVRLASLAHELAHRCEEVLDGVVDDAHAGWGARGITAAVDRYAAALEATP